MVKILGKSGGVHPLCEAWEEMAAQRLGPQGFRQEIVCFVCEVLLLKRHARG